MKLFFKKISLVVLVCFFSFSLNIKPVHGFGGSVFDIGNVGDIANMIWKVFGDFMEMQSDVIKDEIGTLTGKGDDDLLERFVKNLQEEIQVDVSRATGIDGDGLISADDLTRGGFDINFMNLNRVSGAD